MSGNSEFFSLLPPELQMEILLQTDIQTLGQLCQTNSHVKDLCLNETLWRNRFISLTQSPESTFNPAFLELGPTWLTRTRIIWTILHPKKIYTLIKVGLRQPIVLANMLVDNIDHADQCVLHAYKNKVEPIYTAFRSGTYWPINTVNDLRKFFRDAKAFGFSISQNFLFDSEHVGFETLNLIETRVDHNVVFTMRGSDINQFYVYLSAVINLYKIPYVRNQLGLPNIFEIINEDTDYITRHPTRMSYQDDMWEPPILPMNYVIHQLIYNINKIFGIEMNFNIQKVEDMFEFLLHDSTGNQIYNISKNKILPCPPLQMSPLAPSNVPIPPPLPNQFPPPSYYFDIQHTLATPQDYGHWLQLPRSSRISSRPINLKYFRYFR